MPVDGQPKEEASAKASEEVAAYTPAVWNSSTEASDGQLNYRFRGPKSLQPEKSYPLILFLHGAGGRGNDNCGQLVDAGAAKSLEKQKLFGGQDSLHDCYVLAGQVPNKQKWVNVPWVSLDHEMPAVSNSMRMMLECLDAFLADPKRQVDTNRIYVIGLSMGGYGTWDAVQRRPETFAAAVPICGGGDKRLAEKLVGLPIWAWHGDKDPVINVSRSRDMVAAIRAAAGEGPELVKYTEVADRGHDVWVPALSSAEMWEWMLQQKRE